jgi:peptidoglycan/xylan/chitin deacetylase (PgdA/CDA1 family)
MPDDSAGLRAADLKGPSLGSGIQADPRVAFSVMERSGWRELAAAGLYHSGALRLLAKLSERHMPSRWTTARGARSRKVASCRHVILCYHRVGTEGLPIYSYLPPAQFEAQIRFVCKSYRVISLKQLCAEMSDSEEDRPSVTITFDDGYRDVYAHAFPILRAYGVPATVYATVSSIDAGTVPWYDRVFFALQVISGDLLEVPFELPRVYTLGSKTERFRAALEIVGRLRRVSNETRKDLCAFLEKRCQLPQDELAGRMLTWQQVQVMHRAGIAFGSHTMTHPVVSQLNPADLEFEIGDSKRLLEAKLGCPVEDFAFPFGQPADCGAFPSTAFLERGYRSAATTSWGVNVKATDPFRLRRVQIGEECSLPMFALKLSQLFWGTQDGPKVLEPAQVVTPISQAKNDLAPSEIER